MLNNFSRSKIPQLNSNNTTPTTTTTTTTTNNNNNNNISGIFRIFRYKSKRNPTRRDHSSSKVVFLVIHSLNNFFYLT